MEKRKTPEKGVKVLKDEDRRFTALEVGSV